MKNVQERNTDCRFPTPFGFFMTHRHFRYGSCAKEACSCLDATLVNALYVFIKTCQWRPLENRPFALTVDFQASSRGSVIVGGGKQRYLFPPIPLQAEPSSFQLLRDARRSKGCEPVVYHAYMFNERNSKDLTSPEPRSYRSVRET